MALFGRRKPGFSREEIMKPSEIPGEFSDALDPAVNKKLDSNPKYLEKTEYRAKAREALGGDIQAVGLDGETAMNPEEVEEKQTLMEYLETLPEVHDPFEPSEPEPEAPPEPELTDAQILASYIQERTRAAELTPLSLLKKEVEDLDTILPQMESDPQCQTIMHIHGAKDIYYYDNEIMTDNYAMIAMLVADKNVARTIAEMVRWNCKTYPSPTPLAYFQRHPYYLTKPQLDNALRVIGREEQYADIKQFHSQMNTLFLYSDKVMSARYARALADGAEQDEDG